MTQGWANGDIILIIERTIHLIYPLCRSQAVGLKKKRLLKVHLNVLFSAPAGDIVIF